MRLNIADKLMLHHNNALSHTALSATDFFTSKGIPMVPQPPYSPDLSPCGFFLNLKNVLKRRHLGTLENTQKSVTDMLKIILVEDIQRCYQKWEHISIGV